MARARTAPQPIDLRSDTVTQPTQAMRDAMRDARVGDDVYGEDPSVNELQRLAAKAVGMEEALFLPTGTMGNQVAVWVHSQRSGAAIVEETSHISLYEGGGAGLLSGVTLRTHRSPTGVFTPQDIERHVPPAGDAHFVPVRLVSIENTHNYSGGRIWTAKESQQMAGYAHAIGARLHIDGARIFNAAVAQETTAATLCKGADTVMFCLSKGLGAPVGSVLCGSRETIAHAHTVRKTLGGGMRQAGHLAAAGMLALKDGVKRLEEDHANARFLAKGLGAVPGFRVDQKAVATNMVMADIAGTGLSSERMLELLKGVGVLATARDAGPTVRFVTHRNVTRDDCREALERIAGLGF